MSCSHMQRDIQYVVETLKKAKDRGKACTLLIGAGCSVKASIPLAAKFVDLINQEYPYKYSQVKEKTYPHCGRLKTKFRISITAEIRRPSISAVRFTDSFVNLDLIPALKCWAILIQSASR